MMASEIDMVDGLGSDEFEVFGSENVKEFDYHCWSQTVYCEMEGSPFNMSDVSADTPSQYFEKRNDASRDITTLELEILQHPNLDANLSTVCLYVKMDFMLLESISYLRQEGLWNTSMQQLYSNSVQRPQGDHLAELAMLLPSLFQSPPPSLFNLVCEYRKILGSDSTQSMERFLQLLRPSSLEKDRQGLPSRKVAPKGYVYACPSAHCPKIFKKAGHARNHVNSRHPEYLQLNPEYHPESHMTTSVANRISI